MVYPYHQGTPCIKFIMGQIILSNHIIAVYEAFPDKCYFRAYIFLKYTLF